MRRYNAWDISLRVLTAGLALVLIWICADKLHFTPKNASEYISGAAEEGYSDLLALSVSSVYITETTGLDMSIPAAVRSFEMNLRYDGGSEIIRHYDVRGKDENSSIYGYVQIWKAGQGLSHYLKISREYMSANVFGFREEDIKVNGRVWKKWEYIVNDIAVAQGFYEENGQIIICSLCVPYREKTYDFDKIFSELIESVIA